MQDMGFTNKIWKDIGGENMKDRLYKWPNITDKVLMIAAAIGLSLCLLSALFLGLGLLLYVVAWRFGI